MCRDVARSVFDALCLLLLRPLPTTRSSEPYGAVTASLTENGERQERESGMKRPKDREGQEGTGHSSVLSQKGNKEKDKGQKYTHTRGPETRGSVKESAAETLVRPPSACSSDQAHVSGLSIHAVRGTESERGIEGRKGCAARRMRKWVER